MSSCKGYLHVKLFGEKKIMSCDILSFQKPRLQINKQWRLERTEESLWWRAAEQRQQQWQRQVWAETAVNGGTRIGSAGWSGVLGTCEDSVPKLWPAAQSLWLRAMEGCLTWRIVGFLTWDLLKILLWSVLLPNAKLIPEIHVDVRGLSCHWRPCHSIRPVIPPEARWMFIICDTHRRPS